MRACAAGALSSASKAARYAAKLSTPASSCLAWAAVAWASRNASRAASASLRRPSTLRRCCATRRLFWPPRCASCATQPGAVDGVVPDARSAAAAAASASWASAINLSAGVRTDRLRATSTHTPQVHLVDRSPTPARARHRRWASAAQPPGRLKLRHGTASSSVRVDSPQYTQQSIRWKARRALTRSQHLMDGVARRRRCAASARSSNSPSFAASGTRALIVFDASVRSPVSRHRLLSLAAFKSTQTTGCVTPKRLS
mmetsp:Transcript_8536/g.24273  ORF Transcript_8536/g.24273 Transcript_8536/m.24273 type:complete len:257 (-) Transcript_8536:405-1175(-)